MTRLEKVVQERGIKQNFLAAKLGVTEQSVSNWILGKHKMSAEAMMRFCEILNCQPCEIYGTVDEPEPVEITDAA